MAVKNFIRKVVVPTLVGVGTYKFWTWMDNRTFEYKIVTVCTSGEGKTAFYRFNQYDRKECVLSLQLCPYVIQFEDFGKRGCYVMFDGTLDEYKRMLGVDYGSSI